MPAFEISIKQTGKNPRLFEVGGFGDKANFEEFADDMQELLIRTSLTVLKEEQQDGFDKKPRVRVDNKFGKSLHEVNPFGKVEFFAKEDQIKVIEKIYEIIQDKSPIGDTHQYESGNYVFLNNRLVARSRSELDGFLRARTKIGFNDKDIIRFINVNPYARKLERYGVSRGRQRTRYKENKSKSAKKVFALVPSGAYVLAHKTIRRRFKGAASFIKFSFHVNGRRGINIQGAGHFRTTFEKTGQPYLYPMISFGFSAEGILRE